MPLSDPPRLLSVATAVPPHRLDQKAVHARARALFAERESADLDRLLPVFANAGIEARYSCVPLEWYVTAHGWAEKNRLYVANALDLAERASRAAIAESGIDSADIDAVVTVSTSGVATPSLDALLTERMALRRDVQRLPVFGLGCAGGVIGLSRAAQMARAVEGTVLFVVVELCGLTFRRRDQSNANLIAAALFGDGAAAAIVSAEPPKRNGTGNGKGEGNGNGGGLRIGAGGEHTWPGSLDVMGWEVEDDGLGVLFSRDIPNLIRTRYRPALDGFLAAQGLSLSDIGNVVCHPGGAKVIAALEDALDLQSGTLEAPRAVLREYGNMSAATVMFVLDRQVRAGLISKGRTLMSAVGPGFTAGFLILEP